MREGMTIAFAACMVLFFPYLANSVETIIKMDETAERSYMSACSDSRLVYETPKDAGVGETKGEYAIGGVRVIEAEFTGGEAGAQASNDKTIFIRSNGDWKFQLFKKAHIIHESCHLRQWEDGRAYEGMCAEPERLKKLERECNLQELDFGRWVR